MYQEVFKKHRIRARIVGFLGILPGVWFLITTKTQFGHEYIAVRCGFWMLMLMPMVIIWLAYTFLVKRIVTDIRVGFEHMQDLTEKNFYQMQYFSTLFEGFVATLIFIISLAGFLLVDVRCFLSPFVNFPPLPF